MLKELLRLLVVRGDDVPFLIDENLPRSLKHHLRDIFPMCFHVSDLGLEQTSDKYIWEIARASELAILTKDSDFAERARTEGPPPTVIHVRAGNSSVDQIVSLIRENHERITMHVQHGAPLLEIGQSAVGRP